MQKIYFANGPLQDETRMVKAGTIRYEHCTAPESIPISEVGTVDTEAYFFTYYRVGRKHEGFPVFECAVRENEEARDD